MLNRRLQILIDEERCERLARESQPSDDRAGRERAGRELLAMTPPPGPEPDWEQQKRELRKYLIR